MTYKIVRMFTNFHPRDDSDRRTIKTGLTLDEAQAHCRDPQTSGSTATGAIAPRYQHWDSWFDGYEEEK